LPARYRHLPRGRTSVGLRCQRPAVPAGSDDPRRPGTGGGVGGYLRLVLGRGHPRQAGRVHLAHPPGVEMLSYRRVKNDERDAADLADLLRMGRLCEAWIAPPARRELRGWVRQWAKLVGLRSNLQCQVHTVLAAAGVPVAVRPVRCRRAAAAGRGPIGAGVAGAGRLATAADRGSRLRSRAVRQARHPSATHPTRIRPRVTPPSPMPGRLRLPASQCFTGK
jgi:Transposase